MYIQTEPTPNPNSLKFLPGKIVSVNGSYEITNKLDPEREAPETMGEAVALIQEDVQAIRAIMENESEDVRNLPPDETTPDNTGGGDDGGKGAGKKEKSMMGGIMKKLKGFIHSDRRRRRRRRRR